MRAVTLRDVFCVHRTSEGDAAALQGTTLTVVPGEIVCVLGPSGAGKSTLLRVIAGLQTPSAGEVSVLGEDIGRAPARARARLRQACMGFLSQHSATSLPPDMSIGEAIGLPLALRGVPPARQAQRRDELLDAVGLRAAMDARPARLSGGERQRAALCVALAHRPQLLLADEPTGELDETSASEVRGLIVALARAENATAILVSHDAATAAIADRTIRIRDGRLVEEGGALVVGAGGWIRLPSELLAGAQIGDRVQIGLAEGGLLVSAVTNGRVPEPNAAPVPPPVVQPAPRGRWGAAAVEVRALSRRFAADPVLDGLDWSFAPGRVTAVTGRSGTGKTTLLRLLAGLDVPDGGELLIDGAAAQRDGPERRAARRRDRIGYLPQDPAPVGFLSAHENVTLALRLRGLSPGPAAERATEVLVRLGLAERVAQRVSRLSSGEAQRVALARALATARGLVIVDEPTSRLDERAAADVAGLLADTAARDAQTVICATHDERLIARADDVLDLSRARPSRPASPAPRGMPR
jgi:ABC-type lipoprotein export system ATPase subunit